MSKTSDNLDTSGERGRGGWTHGPWVCSPQNNNPFCAWDVKAPNEVNGYICTTSGNAKANAKLIAAAPDLLEALKALCDIRGEDLCYAYSEWEAAHQAIKKATGE